jgi:hypothetical protein
MVKPKNAHLFRLFRRAVPDRNKAEQRGTEPPKRRRDFTPGTQKQAPFDTLIDLYQLPLTTRHHDSNTVLVRLTSARGHLMSALDWADHPHSTKVMRAHWHMCGDRQ